MTHELNISLQLHVCGEPMLRHNSAAPPAPQSAGPGGAAVGTVSVLQRLNLQLLCPSVAPGPLFSSTAVGLRTVLTVILQDPI